MSKTTTDAILPAEAVEHPVERLGLGARPREAVEQHAGLRCPAAPSRSRNIAMMRSSEHEVAARHDRLRLEPERRAVADGGPQHVAGRDVGQAALRRDPGCLRALAGARRAHQDQVEGHGYFRKPL